MTPATTAHEITQTLQQIIDDQPSTIQAFVAHEALGYGDTPEQMFADLAHGGCASGTIGGLIYYHDTHAFFDRYYQEIEELRERFEDETSQPLQVSGDLKNWFAWFAFEQVAFDLAAELGVDW